MFRGVDEKMTETGGTRTEAKKGRHIHDWKVGQLWKEGVEIVEIQWICHCGEKKDVKYEE